MVNVQIKRESELPSEWITAVTDLYHEIFTAESATAERWLEIPDWRVLVLADAPDDSASDLSHWLCTLEIYERTILAGEVEISIGGIGGVLTLPAHRGQKHAERALRRAMLFITDELRLAYGMLFCFPKLRPYYEQLGWLPLTADLIYRDQTGTPCQFNDGMGAMIFEGGGLPFPPGTVDLRDYPW